MRYINDIKNKELPLQFHVGFDKVFTFYQKYAEDINHPFHKSSKEIVEYLNNYPELLEGIEDYTLLEKHKSQIDLMLEPLFSGILTDNEIKAAAIPFSFSTFKLSNRFQNILNNAGDDYLFKIRNLQDDELYLEACVIILASCYGYNVDLKRPFFFDIPDQENGLMKHYRILVNGDFSEVIPTDKAPKITEEDYKLLLDNYGNIDVWKEKFPPDSYIFKGFVLINLFDVTAEETLSSIRENLLSRDENLVSNMQKSLSELFNIKDLMVGFSLFDFPKNNLDCIKVKKAESIIFNQVNDFGCNTFFCEGISQTVFSKKKSIAISDAERYGEQTKENPFYKILKSKKIGSVLLIPISFEDDYFALLEIASPRPYELNSISQNKLKDILPSFQAAVKRSSEERRNVLEATIQEHYTAIHPSVKWRFYEAAEQYQNDLYNGIEKPKLQEIIFNNVYPLYGQSDIKGSSIARNIAIKNDLVNQLNLAVAVLSKAQNVEKLPIYEELMFRIEEYLNDTKIGLNAGDEINILEFLKREIYPVFNHIKRINFALKESVNTYMSRLDKNLQVIYEERKAYELSVNILNEKLANHLDKKQEEAQSMFPHYFERYKTDGVEFNMYIGDSLVNNAEFDLLYLSNLRLWQLKVMCEMENIAHKLKESLENKLEIASLILVHSNSLAIKFRLDENKFDVDGAYNIRYEIIKKRIDKAHIKGTDERLTAPGKIVIIYSQDKDAFEYNKYIKYLQTKNMLGSVEHLEVEDLQGVSGLKALRVEVTYNNTFNADNTIAIDQLINEINAS